MFGKAIEKMEENRNLKGSITKTFVECFSTPKVQENDTFPWDLEKINILTISLITEAKYSKFWKLVKYMWYCKNCKGKERLLDVARSMDLPGVPVGGAFSFFRSLMRKNNNI